MIKALAVNLKNWSSESDKFISSVKHLINFDAMNDAQILDEYKEIRYYLSLVDKSKFYNWGEFNITQLCNEFECGPNGHFLEDGHAYMASLIKNYIHV